MLVWLFFGDRSDASAAPTRSSWIDADGDSQATATSIAVIAPPSGFTGTLRDEQLLCFYDVSTWTPSLTLPAGC